MDYIFRTSFFKSFSTILKVIYVLTAHCGIMAPKGAGVAIGSFAIHRSQAIWGDNANDYDPDRFLPERSVHRHPAAFLPFSYGARNCIGNIITMYSLWDGSEVIMFSHCALTDPKHFGSNPTDFKNCSRSRHDTLVICTAHEGGLAYPRIYRNAIR